MAQRDCVLIVLQSAYARGTLAAGYHPTRWRRELLSSRTGRRLQNLGQPLRVVNCSPVMTADMDEIPEPSLAHVRRAFRRYSPSMVVACGRIAERVCRSLWTGDLLVIPHPAHRVLTNALLLLAGRLLAARLAYRSSGEIADDLDLPCEVAGPFCRLALRQGRGTIRVEAV